LTLGGQTRPPASSSTADRDIHQWHWPDARSSRAEFSTTCNLGLHTLGQWILSPQIKKKIWQRNGAQFPRPPLTGSSSSPLLSLSLPHLSACFPSLPPLYPPFFLSIFLPTPSLPPSFLPRVDCPVKNSRKVLIYTSTLLTKRFSYFLLLGAS